MIYTQRVIRKLAVPSLALLLLCSIYRPWRPVHAQSSSLRPDPGERTLLIRCGVTDKEEKSWSGSLEPETSGAEIVAIEGYHFQPPDKVTAPGSFSFVTKEWKPAFQSIDLSAARFGPRAIFPNGIYATVKGPASARFRLSIGSARHSFSLSDLAAGKVMPLENGN